MKLIKVSKIINTRCNTHYINANQIIEMYSWGGETVIVLSTNEKIQCEDKLEDILNQLQLI